MEILSGEINRDKKKRNETKIQPQTKSSKANDRRWVGLNGPKVTTGSGR